MNEAVAQDGNGGDTQDCAVDRADAAKDAGAAKNDSGNGVEFVSGSGVSFGLSEACGVDDRRKGRDKACEDIGQADSALDRNAGVASAIRRETDGAEGAAKCRSMDEKPDSDENGEENGRLGGYTEEAFLTQK